MQVKKTYTATSSMSCVYKNVSIVRLENSTGMETIQVKSEVITQETNS